MSVFIGLKSSMHFIFPVVLGIALPASGSPMLLPAGDNSDSNPPAEIIVAKPNGGQMVIPRNGYTIRWFAQGIDTVRIEYSVDGGSSWLLISDAVPAVGGDNFRSPELVLNQFMSSTIAKNMGSYVWNVPDREDEKVLIRIIDKGRPSISDVSDKPFSISQRISAGWTTQSVGASVTLWSVSIVDDTTAWTCGREGVVFRTTNGGSSWTQGASLPDHGISIFGLNVDTAFVCVNFPDDGRIYRTSNGGISWTLVFQYTGSSAAMKNVHMFDARKGVAIGDPVGGAWKILQTSNGGLTWDSLSHVPQSGLGYRNSVTWVGQEKGWFGTNGGLAYSTSDKGFSWSYSDVGSQDVFSLVFPDEERGMVSSVFRSIYRTTNGGSTWSYSSTVPGTPLAIIAFLAAAAVPTPKWWATNMDEIYRSTNHGITWTYETLANGYPFNDIAMKYIPGKGVIVGYAVAAADGVVMKYTEVVASVPDGKEDQLPLSMDLYQNYPNPFNPSTVVSFIVHHPAFITLKVYNFLGQEVRTLVNEKKTAGRHTVHFDAGGLSSGVYLYRLSTRGSSLTRKMVFIK